MESLPADKRSLLTEKFHALLDGSDLVAGNAAHGHALDDLETFFLIQGRAFIREVFQEKLQEHIEQTENNDSPHCVECKKKRPSRTSSRKPSFLLTERLRSAVATTLAQSARSIPILLKSLSEYPSDTPRD